MTAKRMLSAIAGLVLLAGWQSARAEDLSAGGRTRSYTVFRPASLTRTSAAPLVLVLHGGFGTGAQAKKSYGWNELADSKGFVVAYPDGVRRSWNAGGGCCGNGYSDNVDDVGFLTALITQLIKQENIDPHRIYLTGISNGAAMSYRYACEGTVPIAAIASISGTMPGGCTKPRPTSVLEIHGLQDRNIPFDGGQGTKGVTKIIWPSVQSSLDAFRRAGDCKAAGGETRGVVATDNDHCAQGRDIRLITIADAGHQWPGASANRPLARLLLDLDPPSTALNATDVAWAFFREHPTP